MFDLLIQGGIVVDGTGNNRYKADIGINSGIIEEIGNLDKASAKMKIDADGLIVSPGFIDCHTHSDLSILNNPSALPKISQGVTTEIVGNCGMSVAPLHKNTKKLLREYVKPVLGDSEVPWDWQSVGDYLKKVEEVKPAVNIAVLVGHGTIRNAVMGFDNRPPTNEEMERMKELVREGMEAGALGISTGLVYIPGVYALTEELIEISKEVASYGGIHATHMRDQVDGLIESVQETLTLGEKANIPVIISHHKTVGKRNYGKVQKTLRLLDEAYDRGLKAYSDTYPYITGSTTLASILPPWAVEGGLNELFKRLERKENRERIANDFKVGLPGWENRSHAIGWENIIISYVNKEKNKQFETKSVLDCSLKVAKEPADFVMSLLLEEQGNVGVIFINSVEEDLLTVIQHPRTMIGSDGLDVGKNPHPRLYGTFPKVLGEYVRERGIMTLEESIHKMTGLTAQQMHISDVGFLQKGYRADATIFNLNEIKDIADFNDSRRLSKGIECVIVGGEIAYKNKQLTGSRNGKVLLRKK